MTTIPPSFFQRLTGGAAGTLPEPPDPRADKPYHDATGADAEARNRAAYEAVNAAEAPPLDVDGDPIINGVRLLDVKAGDFIAMTSVQQLQYLNAIARYNFFPTVSFGGDGARLSGAYDPATASLSALAYTDGPDGPGRVAIPQQMSKADFTALPPNIQRALPTIAASRLSALGLTSGDASRADLIAAVNRLAADVGLREAPLVTRDTSRSDFVDSANRLPQKINDLTLKTYALPPEDLAPFLSQKDALIAGLESNSIFSEADILRQMRDLAARFERARAFYDAAFKPFQSREGTVTTVLYREASPGPLVERGREREDIDEGFPETKLPRITSFSANPTFGIAATGVMDVSGGFLSSTVTGGYEAFIEHERSIASLAQARAELAASGVAEFPTASGATVRRRLDAPTLVMLFQQYANLTAEAKIAADTEEIRQQNALLTDYGRMQQLINANLRLFGSDATQTRALFDDPQDWTQQDLRTAAMFDNQQSPRAHPLETLRGIERPTHNLLSSVSGSNRKKLKTQWETFGTQLSDAVTALNQQTQLKMNDINSADRQKNRHFDLANDALRKLNDMLQNIARAG